MVKRNADLGLHAYTRLVEEARVKLEDLKSELEVQQDSCAKLSELYLE